jgi:hypothetical protein
MRRFWSGLFGLTALAAILLLTAPASEAAEYPWCAQYGGEDGGGTNCGFTTLEQCRSAISGNGGFCVRNPFHPDWDQSKRSNPKPTRH